MRFYKYHGAGNDFLIADGRGKVIDLTDSQISSICNRHAGIGADGVMILEGSHEHDFKMRYYNSDGSGGMMCGNGGRCIVAFAADLGYKHFTFEAPDGIHEAELCDPAVLEIGASGGHSAKPASEENRTAFSVLPRIVRLKMRDVMQVVSYDRNDVPDGCSDRKSGADSISRDVDWFLDTGTRHLVRFVDDVEKVDVVTEGRKLRYDGRFAPEGVNVNFVQVKSSYASGSTDAIIVRTYEKGVEDETLACGTGIVASALAHCLEAGMQHTSGSPDVLETGSRIGTAIAVSGCTTTHHRCMVHSRIARLSVSFDTTHCSPQFSNIWLTGPAAFIGEVNIPMLWLKSCENRTEGYSFAFAK